MHLIMSNFRDTVTEKQHKLDSHMCIYQTFIDNMNSNDEINDIYRQHLLANIETLDNFIFDSYKSSMELKASKDFDRPIESIPQSNKRSNTSRISESRQRNTILEPM